MTYPKIPSGFMRPIDPGLRLSRRTGCVTWSNPEHRPASGDLISLRYHLIFSEKSLDGGTLDRFSPVKQGPRTIEMGEFRFYQFKFFIWEAVRLTLKVVRKIPALGNLG